MSQNKLNLLVVDDDTAILDLVETVFASSEFHVIQARDGVEALKRIDTLHESIDVLLVDVMMPRLNGAELVRAISAHHPAIKIIYMSGYEDDVISRLGITDGKIRFIKKPFTPDFLIQTIRKEYYT